jgi:hypothetical protein
MAGTSNLTRAVRSYASTANRFQLFRLNTRRFGSHFEDTYTCYITLYWHVSLLLKTESDFRRNKLPLHYNYQTAVCDPVTVHGGQIKQNCL